jgi:hypothetical protein
MVTAYGAEELGLCFHGHAYQAGASGRYIGLRLHVGYGHIWGNPNKYLLAKIFCGASNFVP